MAEDRIRAASQRICLPATQGRSVTYTAVQAGADVLQGRCIKRVAIARGYPRPVYLRATRTISGPAQTQQVVAVGWVLLARLHLRRLESKPQHANMQKVLTGDILQ